MGSETLWTGVISRGTRRNGVPTVKVLRAHYGRHCESFSGKKFTRSQDFVHTISAEAPPAVFGPRHQFPLGSPAFRLLLFYETTIGYGHCYWNWDGTKGTLGRVRASRHASYMSIGGI